MEKTGTVCTQVADRSLPQEQLPWSRSTSRVHSPQENGRRDGHQRQCYNCGKSGHLANVCPSKYKVATKTDKKEERNLISIIFLLTCYFY